jgi:hypothetical protein
VAPEILLERAHAKMKALNFEGALPLLRKALESPKLAGPSRARALVYLAITLVNVGEDDEASQTFVLAIDTDPDLTLPKNMSPKIADLFAKAQAARQARLAPPPPPPEPSSAEPPASVETAPLPVPPPASSPAPVETAPVARETHTSAPVETTTAAPTAPPHHFGWPIVSAAIGAVALGAGIASADISQSTSVTIRTSLHTQSDTDILVSRQRLASDVSITGYAVAGVAAAAAAILFAGELGGHWFSANAAVSPQSASIGLRTSF